MPGVVSPSKYASVKYLSALAQDHYLGKGGQEYSEEEVKLVLNQKLQAKADDFLEAWQLNQSPKSEPKPRRKSAVTKSVTRPASSNLWDLVSREFDREVSVYPRRWAL